ncbi:hypothetical protein HDK77DRAFT_285158 [Phyllosticta capitalensis]
MLQSRNQEMDLDPRYTRDAHIIEIIWNATRDHGQPTELSWDLQLEYGCNRYTTYARAGEAVNKCCGNCSPCDSKDRAWEWIEKAVNGGGIWKSEPIWRAFIQRFHTREEYPPCCDRDFCSFETPSAPSAEMIEKEREAEKRWKAADEKRKAYNERIKSKFKDPRYFRDAHVIDIIFDKTRAHGLPIELPFELNIDRPHRRDSRMAVVACCYGFGRHESKTNCDLKERAWERIFAAVDRGGIWTSEGFWRAFLRRFLNKEYSPWCDRIAAIWEAELNFAQEVAAEGDQNYNPKLDEFRRVVESVTQEPERRNDTVVQERKNMESTTQGRHKRKKAAAAYQRPRQRSLYRGPIKSLGRRERDDLPQRDHPPLSTQESAEEVARRRAEEY